MKSKSKKSAYQAPEKDLNTQMQYLMQNEIDELKDAVRYLEQQLNTKKKEQEAIMRELDNANVTAHGHESNYNKEQAINKSHTQRLDEMRQKLQNHKDAQGEVSIYFVIKYKLIFINR
jgi:hypothetical protein